MSDFISTGSGSLTGNSSLVIPSLSANFLSLTSLRRPTKGEYHLPLKKVGLVVTSSGMYLLIGSTSGSFTTSLKSASATPSLMARVLSSSNCAGLSYREKKRRERRKEGFLWRVLGKEKRFFHCHLRNSEWRLLKLGFLPETCEAQGSLGELGDQGSQLRHEKEKRRRRRGEKKERRKEREKRSGILDLDLDLDLGSGILDLSIDLDLVGFVDLALESWSLES